MVGKMSPEPVEFRSSRGWNTVFLMGALIFVGLGLWLVMRRESDARARWSGAGNVLFFGACAWVFVREDRRPQVRLRLDASGLDLRHPRPGAGFRFEWKAVASATVRHEERASLVVVALRSPEGLPEEVVPDWARSKGAWPPRRPMETVLSPSELGTDATVLAAEIERFRRYYADAPPSIRREDMM